MSATYELSPRAKAELRKLIAETRQKINNYRFARHLIMRPGYLAEVEADFQRRFREIGRASGSSETSNDRTVRVQCPRCLRIESIPGDVLRWTCVCGSIERFAFQTYYEEKI